MSRQYDVVLLGASGFTGKLTAEYVHRQFPADLRWAIAGRSESKLSSVLQDLKAVDTARPLPAIETASLNKDELKALSSRAKILINTIGPYNKYSTPVVEACVETNTHYLDVTGEAPWVKKIVAEYDAAARRNGTIVIPQCGIESSPADVLTYVLASNLRKRANQAVREVVVALARMDAKPSGGTLASALGIFEDYGLLTLKSASAPQAQFPAGVKLPPSPPSAAGILHRLTGLRSVKEIGTVGLPLLNSVDTPIIQRTWALLQEKQQPEAYGPEFRFTVGIKTRGVIGGVVHNLAAIVGPLLLALAPIRWLIRRIAAKPGEGPSKEVEAKGYMELRGVAAPEGNGRERSTGSLRWTGGMYALTAVVVAEAAATLLYSEDRTIAKRLGGGLLTPATLGDTYVDRLRDAGVKIDVNAV